jgi:hypothetical protein
MDLNEAMSMGALSPSSSLYMKTQWEDSCLQTRKQTLTPENSSLQNSKKKNNNKFLSFKLPLYGILL